MFMYKYFPSLLFDEMIADSFFFPFFFNCLLKCGSILPFHHLDHDDCMHRETEKKLETNFIHMFFKFITNLICFMRFANREKNELT